MTVVSEFGCFKRDVSNLPTHYVPEHALMHLPRRRVVEYRRGQVIYDRDRPPTHLFLVLRGLVKLCLCGAGETEIIVDIISANEMFGEAGLISATCGDAAVALDNAALMSWTIAEIQERISHDPRLSVMLIRLLADRCITFGERLQSFALDDTYLRLARSLLRLAKRLGTNIADGSVRIPSLSHQVLSAYIGTSREIVTMQMNRLRAKGYIQYSRRSIDINVEPLRDSLRP